MSEALSSKGRERRATCNKQSSYFLGLQLLLILLVLFCQKCHDFSKPRVPHVQVVSRQGVAIEDAQIEHVLLTDTGPDCYRRQKANLSCHGVEEDRNLSS